MTNPKDEQIERLEKIWSEQAFLDRAEIDTLRAEVARLTAESYEALTGRGTAPDNNLIELDAIHEVLELPWAASAVDAVRKLVDDLAELRKDREEAKAKILAYLLLAREYCKELASTCRDRIHKEQLVKLEADLAAIDAARKEQA